MFDVKKIAQKYIDEFFPGLGMPDFEIVNRIRVNWLGRAVMKAGIKDGKKAGMERPLVYLQKSILSDEKSLERIVAHELIHCYEYQEGEWYIEFFNSEPSKQRRMMRYQPDGHGEFFRKYAAKINSVKGDGFVSEKSDETVVVKHDDRKFYLVVEKYKDGKMAISSFLKKTPIIKAEIKRRAETQEVKIFQLSMSEYQSLFMPQSLGKFGKGRYKAGSDEDLVNKLWASNGLDLQNFVNESCECCRVEGLSELDHQNLWKMNDGILREMGSLMLPDREHNYNVLQGLEDEKRHSVKKLNYSERINAVLNRFKHGAKSAIKEDVWTQENSTNTRNNQKYQNYSLGLMESKDLEVSLSTLKEFSISNRRIALREIHQYFQSNKMADTEKQNLIKILDSGESKKLKVVSKGKIDKDGQCKFKIVYRSMDGYSDHPSNYRIEFDAVYYPEYSQLLTITFLRIGQRKEFIYDSKSTIEVEERYSFCNSHKNPIAKNERYNFYSKIKEGAGGDWHKEGYKIDNIGPADYEGADDGQAEEFFTANEHLRPYDFIATDPSGEPVAFARIGPTKDNKNIYAYDIEVEELHRRKGIASEMYKMAEKFFGKKMRKGVTGLSKDSEALWGSDKRVFGESGKNTIRLYRGLSEPFNSNYDISKTDAPHGYSTWTDSLELAKQYAGEKGHIYYIDLPKEELGSEIMDKDGDRHLFYFNNKSAGLHGVSGKEFLVYNHHDLYSPNMIKKHSESVDESVGDWKSLGYKLDHRPLPENLFGKMGKKGMEVFVTNKKGKEIAHARAEVRRSKSTVFDVYVNPEDRRKGLATAMYQYIERHTGTKIQKSGDQTDQGKALWKHGQKSNGEKHFGESVNNLDKNNCHIKYNRDGEALNLHDSKLNESCYSGDVWKRKFWKSKTDQRHGLENGLRKPSTPKIISENTLISLDTNLFWKLVENTELKSSLKPNLKVTLAVKTYASDVIGYRFWIDDGNERTIRIAVTSGGLSEIPEKIEDHLDKYLILIISNEEGLNEAKNPRESGYDFTSKIDSGNLVIKAWKDGVKVGEMECAPSSAEPGKILVLNVEVDKEHRRKGIATEIYKIAEKHFNMPFRKANQTKDGKKFRKAYDKTSESSNLLDEKIHPSIEGKIKFEIDSEADDLEINAIIDGDIVGNVTVTTISDDGVEMEFEPYSGEKFYDSIVDNSFIVNLQSLNVEDDYLGKGIAKQLMNMAVKEMKKRYPGDPVFINASPMGSSGLSFNDLLGFYKSYGFKVLTMKFKGDRNAPLWIDSTNKLKILK